MANFEESLSGNFAEGISGDVRRNHLPGNSMNRRTLLCAWAWLLFLLDDQLPDMQTSDFEFLDIEALDPAPLHSQRPDR